MSDQLRREVDCRCEPCPFDVRSVGFKTCKESPEFAGTKCLWHEQIVGKLGVIFVSGGTKDKPRFISAKHTGEYLNENIVGVVELVREARRLKSEQVGIRG